LTKAISLVWNFYFCQLANSKNKIKFRLKYHALKSNDLILGKDTNLIAEAGI